jgi:hypothetical protein
MVVVEGISSMKANTGLCGVYVSYENPVAYRTVERRDRKILRAVRSVLKRSVNAYPDGGFGLGLRDLQLDNGSRIFMTKAEALRVARAIRGLSIPRISARVKGYR